MFVFNVMSCGVNEQCMLNLENDVRNKWFDRWSKNVECAYHCVNEGKHSNGVFP